MNIEEKIILVIIVLMILTLFGLLFGSFFISNIGISNGTHTGYVTAVQESGVIWQTKRAYIKTSTESTQEDAYCVQEDAVYQALMEKTKTGERVSVTFSHPLIEWNWNCGHEAEIIVDVIN